jgi:hypothetical protein
LCNLFVFYLLGGRKVRRIDGLGTVNAEAQQGTVQEHLPLNHSEASAEGAFAESDADMVKG